MPSRCSEFSPSRHPAEEALHLGYKKPCSRSEEAEAGAGGCPGLLWSLELLGSPGCRMLDLPGLGCPNYTETPWSSHQINGIVFT